MKRILSWLAKHEYWFAVIFMLGGVAVAQWSVLAAPNSLYPQTVDGMGHLAKIKYIADCLREGVWPAWFPYWYNGATTVQYYPPLSYLWAVPAQLITDNVMISFKWLTASSMFIGSMGVWLLCRTLVGPGVGMVGGLAYILQPFLNRSLFLSGTVAQAPIFALSPWLLYFSLLYIRSGRQKHWLGITLITGALILSQAMHAFMVVMCLGVVLLASTLLRYNHFNKFLGWVLAIICAGGLTAFWSIPGATMLENPGIPFLLPEATALYTATPYWFSWAAREGTGYYFNISLLLISLLALLPLRKSQCNEKEEQSPRMLIWALFLSLAFSIWLSFGHRWTLYSLIPMHSSLVPGRILSYSAILGSVLLAVAIYKISRWKKVKIIFRSLLILLLVAIVMIDMKPMFNRATSYQEVQDSFKMVSHMKLAEQARFSWIWPSGSEMTYFPYADGVMMADGWNIEGTPHNQTLWNHNIAISAGCSAYITRNLLQWNVRSLFVSNNYLELQRSLEQHGFTLIEQDEEKGIYTSSIPSAYIMQLKRNALVIGRSAAGMAMTYPWLLQGSYPSLEDYPLDMLGHFKLIYLVDPVVKDMDKFENQVKELIRKNVTVVIEPGRVQPPSFFDIVPYAHTRAQTSLLVANPVADLKVSPFRLAGVPVDAPFIGGMDEILWETDESGEKGPVFGFKRVGQEKVYFVGLSLSEQLEASWQKSRGMEVKAPDGATVKAALEKILDLGKPVKEIMAEPLTRSSINWRTDGFSFTYSSQETKPAWVSVTYTPRWRVTIDGEEHPAYNLENLVLLDLPAGNHTINFYYGITWVGMMGIIVTGVTLLTLIILLIFPRWLDHIRQSLAQGAKSLVDEVFS